MIENYRNAGYPAIAVETVEEERFIETLLRQVERDAPLLKIAATGALLDMRARLQIDAKVSYAQAIAAAFKPNSVLIICDIHHIISNPGIYRVIRDALAPLKQAGSMLVMLAPTWKLPPELEHEIPVVAWDLPTRDQLRQAAEVCSEAAQQPMPAGGQLELLLDAAAGLTLSEAENAMALALVESGRLDPSLVWRTKQRLIREPLSVSPQESPENIGGLHNLVEYLRNEVVESKDDPELAVRGILLNGIAGTGKSLTAKAAGAILGWPVVRLDIAGCRGSLVGQSEATLRQALRVIDAVAPCVVWFDELEKAVGGYASSAHTDSGVTLGLVGTLLTWMQERKSRTMVVATCNDPSKLPPEMTRAGRFDAVFFLDLPTEEERVAIAKVHLRKLHLDEGFAEQIAALSDGWTGAEIEECIRSAARRSRRSLTALVVEEAARQVKPISRTRAEEIQQMREHARDRWRLANTTPTASAGASRKVRVPQ